jgi:hypothetical protein
LQPPTEAKRERDRAELSQAESDLIDELGGPCTAWLPRYDRERLCRKLIAGTPESDEIHKIKAEFEVVMRSRAALAQRR